MTFIFFKAFVAFFVLTCAYIVIVGFHCAGNNIPVKALYLSVKHRICSRVLSIGLCVSLIACLVCWVVGV